MSTSTAQFNADGRRHTITREQAEAAASRLTPAHSSTFNQHRDWYALVGSGIYYVKDLIAEATGVEPSDAKTARLALAELGFPVLCWAWGSFLRDGNR
ncbi:hypothetical protein [Streptomyces aidingensis]|uniref:Uncharacterized protein n=1 Tax=Streptomyces aidingensis TaxID=910347 RepID=A0A1I1VD30_9ACTN|nr:hypothetical protein [Streptomyces aidingensis]SFD80846.1 hypothetical protein SAMN05421773_1341 [Streptomyces aidingensis]